MSNSNKDIIVVDGVAFSVNAIGYRIAMLLQDECTPNEIVSILEREGYSVLESDVQKIQLKLTQSKKYRRSPITPLCSVPVRLLGPIVNSLVRLFNYYVLVLSIIIHIPILLDFSIFEYGVLDYGMMLYDNPFLLAVYLIVCVLVLFIHELGHVSAANRCNVEVEKIGLGIYLSYVVFYTDVTNSWLANRKQRLLIDSGGIYFQLILSAILVLCVYLSDGIWKMLWLLLFWDNLIVALVNINPFAMFDGYWILSDLFNVRNLRIKSYRCLAGLYLRLIREGKGEVKCGALEVYSILSFVFLVGLYFWSVYKLIITIALLCDYGFLSVKIIVKASVYIIVIYYFTKTIYNSFLQISRNVQELRRTPEDDRA